MQLPEASIEALQQAYQTLIPISQHMGIQAVSYDGQCLRVTAPLANNINHQQSAFGGSLFSLVALAGWGLLQLKITELGLDCTTVIAGGEVGYQVPVVAELCVTAACQQPTRILPAACCRLAKPASCWTQGSCRVMPAP